MEMSCDLVSRCIIHNVVASGHAVYEGRYQRIILSPIACYNCLLARVGASGPDRGTFVLTFSTELDYFGPISGDVWVLNSPPGGLS